MKSVAPRLAEGIAGAAALLNPEMIILGGGVIEAMPEEYFNEIMDEVKKRTFEPSLNGLEVKRAVGGPALRGHRHGSGPGADTHGTA